MRFPVKAPSYQWPDATPEQNALWVQTLQEWEQPNPYVRMLGGSQTISTLGAEAVNWHAESTFFLRQGMAAPTTASTFILAPYTCIYELAFRLVWENAGGASTGGLRQAQIVIVRGGTTAYAHAVEAAAYTQQGAAVCVPLKADDRVILRAQQGGSSNVNIIGGEDGTWMSLTALGINGRST